jgi:hypothetical protein
MVKVTRSSVKKNEEIEELVSENSETETETESEEEEEESSMEETSGDEDCMREWKTVSNIFIIIYIHII